jgi:hypothetical protein
MRFTAQFTILINNPAKRAGQNPTISSPGTIPDAIFKRIALITRVNSPKVRIFMGRVRSIKIGLKKRFKNPRIPPAKRAEKRLST